MAETAIVLLRSLAFFVECEVISPSASAYLPLTPKTTYPPIKLIVLAG